MKLTEHTYTVFFIGAAAVFIFDFVVYAGSVVPLKLDPQLMYYTLLTFSVTLFLGGLVEMRFEHVLSDLDKIAIALEKMPDKTHGTVEDEYLKDEERRKSQSAN